MSSEIDLESLDPVKKKKLVEIMGDPLKWASTLIRTPDTGKPFEPNYVQRLILSSSHRETFICAHRRCGKCVSGFTKIIDGETLTPIPIHSAQNIHETFTFDFKTNEVKKVKCRWIKSGVKKCICIRLVSGGGTHCNT